MFTPARVFYDQQKYKQPRLSFADDGRLTLDTLLEWWREYHSETHARLILVLDTNQSHRWVKPIRSLQDDYVAIQTFRPNHKVVSDDLEGGSKNKVGEFTAEWVTYNCSIVGKYADWLDKERTFVAVYGTSRCWTNFTFHLPDSQDMEYHWDINFPKITKPLIKVTNFPQVGKLCFCCKALLRCLRRKRMLWLPPLEVYTGHGFHLVRS